MLQYLYCIVNASNEVLFRAIANVIRWMNDYTTIVVFYDYCLEYKTYEDWYRYNGIIIGLVILSAICIDENYKKTHILH